MRGVAAIVVKEALLLARDPGSLFLLFVLPAIFIFVLSLALQGVFATGSHETIDVLVVDDDRGEAGKKIREGLADTGSLRVVTTAGGKKLTLAAAKGELDGGRAQIIIHVPAGASAAARFDDEKAVEVIVDPVLSTEFVAKMMSDMQRFVSLLLVDYIKGEADRLVDEIDAMDEEEPAQEASGGGTATPEKKPSPTAQCAREVRREMKKLAMQGPPPGGGGGALGGPPPDFKELAKKKVQECVRRKKKEESAAAKEEKKEEVKEEATAAKEEKQEEKKEARTKISQKKGGLTVRETHYASGREEVIPDSVQQSVPGWTIFALFWIAQTIALNFVGERQSGAFGRLLVAPLGAWQFFLGKIIPFFLINMLQALFMFAIGVFVLPLCGGGRLVLREPGGLVILTTSVSLASIAFGLLVATIVRTLQGAALVTSAFSVVLAVAGGIFVPKFVMPHFLRRVCDWVPHGWALEGYHDLLVRGEGTGRILPKVWMLLAVAAVLFVAAALRFRRMRRIEG